MYSKRDAKKNVLFETNMFNSIYTTPGAANGVLYITNRRLLFAIAEGASGKAGETH